MPAYNRLQPGTLESTYLAFDTGPGNVLVDAAIRILSDGQLHYDHNGASGAKGESEINNAVVEQFLASEPYFRAKLPKTTGRELFSDDMARELVQEMQASGMSNDAIISTVTRITAESIARAYEDFVIPLLGEGGNIDEIYICGGGAYNPNILKHLRARFPKSKVMKLNDAPMKLNPSAKEAVMFALLGFLALCGRTVPTAACSETHEPAVMGVITPGDNYHRIMRAVVEDEGFMSSRVLGRITM